MSIKDKHRHELVCELQVQQKDKTFLQEALNRGLNILVRMVKRARLVFQTKENLRSDNKCNMGLLNIALSRGHCFSEHNLP